MGEHVTVLARIVSVAELPLPLASAVHRVLALVNKLTRGAETLWRHAFRHGRYLRPAREID